jgi:hypothetical protein
MYMYCWLQLFRFYSVFGSCLLNLLEIIYFRILYIMSSFIEKVCTSDEFKCDDKSRCIDIKWKCDGDFDCGDHTDETSNCTHSHTHSEEPEVCNPTSEFKCLTSGECIHKSWQCDGDPDCTDSSDEGKNCKYIHRLVQRLYLSG